MNAGQATLLLAITLLPHVWVHRHLQSRLIPPLFHVMLPWVVALTPGSPLAVDYDHTVTSCGKEAQAMVWELALEIASSARVTARITTT